MPRSESHYPFYRNLIVDADGVLRVPNPSSIAPRVRVWVENGSAVEIGDRVCVNYEHGRPEWWACFSADDRVEVKASPAVQLNDFWSQRLGRLAKPRS